MTGRDQMVDRAAVAIGLIVGLGISSATTKAQDVNPRPASGSGFILWEKNMTSRAGLETTTWEPLDGYESLSECRDSAKPLLQAAANYMPTTEQKCSVRSGQTDDPRYSPGARPAFRKPSTFGFFASLGRLIREQRQRRDPRYADGSDKAIPLSPASDHCASRDGDLQSPLVHPHRRCLGDVTALVSCSRAPPEVWCAAHPAP